HGMWLNAFKPGTVAQVRRVVAIAQAAPQHTIFVHLEGGKAGGHHSWEDLDDLLLHSYHHLRAEPNIVLCVGGGVGTPDRTVQLLTGQWSAAYGLRPMPIDAVFLGTLTMAVAEAMTSPQVKQALVQASGCLEWVHYGQVSGEVTSGRSSLNADIHYLDNRAARCGRLLDEVAGDAEAVAHQRDTIAEALNATAKPYFGDLEQMTYLQVLERAVELMAVGRGGRYEDGPWPDPTYRTRVLDLIHRIEARMCEQDEGTLTSQVTRPEELDQPHKVVARIAAAYPKAGERTLQPADVHHFIRNICARPGKPVNFVPVIDQDVRRWYKSDALWQSHDDRFEADQVLIIPGPEALLGLDRADEPVAELLERFETATVDALETDPSNIERLECRRTAIDGRLPSGIMLDVSPTATTLRAQDPDTGDAWFNFIGAYFEGPLAAFVVRPTLHMGPRVVNNPIRALCKAEPGALIVVETDAHRRAQAMTYASADGEQVELVLERENGVSHLRLVMHVPHGPDGMGAATWTLPVTHVRSASGDAFMTTPEADREALVAFYHRALFGGPLEATPLFAWARDQASIQADEARAYAAATGAGTLHHDALPLNMAFSLVWKPLFSALSGEAIGGGLLRLVHLSNHVEIGPGWPVAPGEEVAVEARVTRVEDGSTGRTIRTLARINRAGVLCAEVTSAFFVRGDPSDSAWLTRWRETVTRQVSVETDAEVQFWGEHPWLTLHEGTTLNAGDRLTLSMDAGMDQPREVGVPAHVTAMGWVKRNGETIGTVELDAQTDAVQHPVLAALSLLGGEDENAMVRTPRLT
ncbi:MAG: fatty acid synthase subunit beta domain-containing protein, partial [Myxococcota bacterium]